MTDRWIGCLVEADCCSLGIYSGILTRVNTSDQSIVLCDAARDGKKCAFGEVTIGVEDIADLKIVKECATAADADEHASSLLLPAMRTTNNTSHSRKEVSRKKSDVTPQRKPQKRDGINGPFPASRQRANTLPSGGISARRLGFSGLCNGGKPHHQGPSNGINALNEVCFGEGMSDVDADFDFESNLALFDKRAVFSEIDALLEANDRQTIRLVECNRRSEPKYRNDENILSTAETVTQRKQTSPTLQQYTAVDNGTVVASLSRQSRDALLLRAEKFGLDAARQRELLGSAAADMIVNQLNVLRGGLQSSYTIVVLCSPSKSGFNWTASEAGLCAARHLANHGHSCVILLTADSQSANQSFIVELELCKLSGASIVYDESKLPKGLDALISCTIHPYMSHCPAPILLLDPSFVAVVQNVRWILYALRPLSVNHCTSTSDPADIYLCDLGIPRRVFELCGVEYLDKLFHHRSVIRVRPNNHNNNVAS